MIISDGAIKLDCPACKSKRIEVGFKIQMTYLWKSQFGCSIRLFCHVCGDVHDLKQIYSQGDAVTVVKKWHFTPDMEIPF